MFTLFSSLIKCFTYTFIYSEVCLSVWLNIGTAILFITLDWAVSTFNDRYVTFFLTNCIFPTQIREITFIYFNRYRGELYRKVSKSTIELVCLIFFLQKTQNNRNVTVQQVFSTLLIKRVSSSMLNGHRWNVYITIHSRMLLSINKRESAKGVPVHGTLYTP